MRQLVERKSESRALPGAQRGLNLDQRAINRSGSRAKTPVDALHGCMLLGMRQRAPRDLLGQNDGWGCLALDARRKDLLSQRLCTGARNSAYKPGQCAFQDRAFSRGHSDEMREANKQSCDGASQLANFGC
jgi:hypothetical protein